mmetsp:Transcript_1912/g.4246  ORF Transcript_1912/g.4246 Transcript_1912/m.4246 type:complete len:258 (-) Transcript_1912:324-1097(-)
MGAVFYFPSARGKEEEVHARSGDHIRQIERPRPSFQAFSSSAATPGRTFPSRSSKLAPPPVEMWDISPALPLCSHAATESPPPMMVMAPPLVMSARMSTIPNVPLLNFSNSKTPMGPFMMTVLQSARKAFCSSVDWGPLSRPIHPSGMESDDTVWVLASGEKASAQTMSEGRRISFPSVSALAMTSLAVSTKSSSTRDVPTDRPLAFRNVKTIPPPTMILSHLSNKAFRTVIFDETFDPPTMAAMGFSPSRTAPSRY